MKTRLHKVLVEGPANGKSRVTGVSKPEEIGQSSQPATEWTPGRGLQRGLTVGLLVAALAALALAALAAVLPILALAVVLRTALGVSLAWLLCVVVERAAGMEGWSIRSVAVALTVLVLCSQHLVFARVGVTAPPVNFPGPFGVLLLERLLQGLVPVQNGVLIGWQWLDPRVLLIVNAVPVLGGVLALVYRGVR